MNANRKVAAASVAGQNAGALTRAAIINGALFVRDTVAAGARGTQDIAKNTVAPKAKVYASAAGTNVKAGAAFAVSFVRTLVQK